jgi:hypothetical protein
VREKKFDEKGRNDWRGRVIGKLFRGGMNIMLGRSDQCAASTAGTSTNRIQDNLRYAFRFPNRFPPSLCEHL